MGVVIELGGGAKLKLADLTDSFHSVSILESFVSSVIVMFFSVSIKREI